MQLTGDMDVSINISNNPGTNPTVNQITGLDLNGSGDIARDGKENALVFPATSGFTGTATGFMAIDAYTRLDNGVVNETDITGADATVFLGDIVFRGTGNAGDGKSTNGNIVLAGLGADSIFTGIGNDFIAAGGVAVSREGGRDFVSAGRNSDFIFAELSAMTNTDGNELFIDGGSTADDSSAATTVSSQDSDWLLLQAADDDERIEVELTEDVDSVGMNPGNDGTLTTRAGQYGTLRDIENLDASGNTYGFIKDMNTTLGGAPVDADGNPVDANNNGIGSSGQLNVLGSEVANIIIGGYDNDAIDGSAGNDLLMGGNLKSYLKDGVTVGHQLINPNLVGLVGGTDGIDRLSGGDGDDNIVFEADDGGIDGGTDAETTGDTLWLTANSLGTNSAATVLDTDLTLRFDLLAQNIDAAAGYGGADVDGTQDQTNYSADVGTGRVTVMNMESVIATGLGAIDFKAAGTNTATDVTFANQQNFLGYTGNVDLRGSEGANTLYANSGEDVIEGREGDDLLSGGDKDDDFVFDLQGGDDIDVIHRQTNLDVNADGVLDNLTDGTFGRDFGLGGDTLPDASFLIVDFTATDLAAGNKEMSEFEVVIGGVVFKISAAADVAELRAAENAEEVAAVVGRVFTAQDATVTVGWSGNVLTITDAQGRDMSDTSAEGLRVRASVDDPDQQVTNPGVTFSLVPGGETQDRLIFAAYDDRADGEMVDDDAGFGGDTLGSNAYAQDLVVGFDRDGSTVLAESQAFQVNLENLAVEDEVTVDVNGVKFTLTVGRELNNELIAGETTQAFALRLSNYINDYLDDDTAAGKVLSTTDGTGDDGDGAADGDGNDPSDDGVLDGATDTDGDLLEDDLLAGQDGDANTGSFILTQDTYGGTGEETVFMTVTVNVDDNSSNGEGASTDVINLSSTDITLLDFSGRDGAFNADNVLFVGDADIGSNAVGYSSINRSVLATADETTGGVLNGSDAIVVHVKVDDDITDSADESIAGTPIDFNVTANATTGEVTNFAIHGDDQLIGGSKADTISAGTGDDRIYGSLGADHIDGGKDLYWVDGVIRVRNAFEAADIDGDPATIEIRKLADSTGDGDVDGNDLGADVAQKTSDFDDTLVYQQSDFGAVGVGGATFNIAIDLSDDQANSGSGRVITNGSAANTALFVEIENLRTVSGDGTWVGQGNDTLDLSTSIGIDRDTWVATSTTNNLNTYYNLTNDGLNEGQIWLDRDEDADADTVQFLNFISIVDGVENVTFGGGNDFLEIDETEAGKDNEIIGGAGDDTVSYSFDIDPDNEFNPAVTLMVNGGGANIDHVHMTDAALGLDNPLDVLNSIETILFGDAMHNPELDDTLDVTDVTDAVVDFVNGQVRTDAGAIQVRIGSMDDFEIVEGDSDDTVIVDAAEDMDNSRTDLVPAVDVTANSFLNYDEVDADDVRMTTADLRAANDLAAIPDALNIGLFQFNLGVGTDRMDYSLANDTIVVAPNLMVTSYDFNVLVDNNNDIDGIGFGAGLDDAGDRIDVVTGVEEVVASQGTSIIDLTANVTAAGDYVNKDVIITYMAQADAELADAWDATDEAMQSNARYEFRVRLEDAGTSTPFDTLTFVEYRDADATDDLAVAGAYWNRIEGSDGDETVQFTASQEATEHTLNLRGGDNTVLYNLQTNGVGLSINSLTNGVTSVNLNAKDAGGIATAFDDTVTSYNGNNDIDTGSLTIYGSTLFRDSIDLASVLNNNVYLLGQIEDGLAKLDVTFSVDGADVGLSLIGFENLVDGGGDDVYQMADLENFFDTFEAVTDTAGDNDTLQVFDASLVDLAPPFGIDWSAGTIIVAELEDAIDGADDAVQGFDFDSLDISQLTDQVDVVITDDAGETLIFGDLGNFGDALTIGDVQGFDIIKFTTVAGMGDDVVIDMDLLEFRQADGTVLFTFDDASVFDFSAVVDNMTVNVVDTGAVGVTIITDGVDVIAGADGDDFITGGAGADTLSGGFIAAEGATLTVTIPGVGTTSGTAVGSGVMEIFGLTLTTAAIPATELQIAENSDADQIGTRFANVADATWIAALAATALGAGEADALVSVDYDSDSNELLFTFDTTLVDGVDDGTTILALDLTGASTPTDGGNALFVPAELGVDFVARDDSADNFIFFAGDSTRAAADTITDFDATDTIWIDAGVTTDDAPGLDDNGVIADFTYTAVELDTFFVGGEIVVASDGVNGMVYIDSNDNGDLDSTDMQIVMEGQTDTTAFNSLAQYVVATLGTAGEDSFVGANTVAVETFFGGSGADSIVLTDTVAGNDRVIFSSVGDGDDTITGFATTEDDIIFLGAFQAANLTGTTGNAATAAAYAAAYDGNTFVGSVRVVAAGVATATAADLLTLADIQTAFGVITNENVGDELLIAFSSTDGNTALYYWQAADTGNDLDAAELTLIGVVDETLVVGDFGFAV